MNKLYTAAGLLVLSMLFFPLILAAAPMLQDGDHRHIYLETSIAQVRIEANSTNARQGTQISALQATQQVLPSPTLITASPTKTATPQSTFPTPTIEDARTPSSTPFPTFTPTHTVTPANTPLSTRPPFLDPDFTCRVVTTSNLTKRLTPSPSAENLGVLPSGSNVLIAPYQGSIPYTTTNGLWYVPVVTNAGEIEYYILYARTSPPSEATPGVTPPILEVFLFSADPAVLCIPIIIRN